MKTRTTLATTASLAAVGALLLTGTAGTSTANASVDTAAPVARHDGAAPVAQQAVSTRYSADVVALMARTSGRTVAAQKAQLARQDRANNIAARLQAAGHHFDGLFLDGRGDLVVQATPGSASAAAAKAAGATVRDPAYGEARLTAIRDQLSDQSLQGVASVEVDLVADRVVVTRFGTVSAQLARTIRAQGKAVVVRDGAANHTHASVNGGDEIVLQNGHYCSAGFPGHDSSGARVMVWVGHCVEDSSYFRNSSGTRIGTYGDGDYVSFDGNDDYDTGYVRMDAEDTISVVANDYGSGRDLDASRGSWKPAVGTEVCNTGATSGVNCGKISSYGNTVTYVDNSGNEEAVIRGLAKSTACTAGGDSGGAWSSGGYGIGLTSGGPTGQKCGWNGGFQSGKSSWVQPVVDVLSRYDLTYN